MTAFDGFVPVIVERHTVTKHRDDDHDILGDAGDPECVKSILEPAPLEREKALIQKDKR